MIPLYIVLDFLPVHSGPQQCLPPTAQLYKKDEYGSAGGEKRRDDLLTGVGPMRSRESAARRKKEETAAMRWGQRDPHACTRLYQPAIHLGGNKVRITRSMPSNGPNQQGKHNKEDGRTMTFGGRLPTLHGQRGTISRTMSSC